MAARRGLSILGAVVALLLAALGGAWFWLVVGSERGPTQVISVLALIVVSAFFCARCVSHLLATLPSGPARLGEATGADDVADPRLSMLGDDRRAAQSDPLGRVCPWCAAPLRPKAVRCPACMERL